MADLLHRQLLIRAVTRGLLKQSQVLEVTRRLARGQPLAEALRELGAAPEAVDALADASLVGRTLGRFRIDALLGCGGMGTVYRARQLGLEREVAVKVFDIRFALHASEVERFRREAQSACRLDHPHVIQPIDFGEEGPILYLAMEYAAGGSAEARLAARGRYSEEEALDTLGDIAGALDYAASRGLVHRDIKPGNILYSAAGTAKLGDLGLVLDTQAARLTEGDAATGTVHYMAPEQALARPLDIRADVYGLGITTFELLTGQPPYDGPSAIAIVAQHMKSPFPDLRARRPELSVGLAALIARMCAKAAASRPTPAQLGALVDDLREGRGVAGPAAVAVSGSWAAVVGIPPAAPGPLAIPAAASAPQAAPSDGGVDAPAAVAASAAASAPGASASAALSAPGASAMAPASPAAAGRLPPRARPPAVAAAAAMLLLVGIALAAWAWRERGPGRDQAGHAGHAGQAKPAVGPAATGPAPAPALDPAAEARAIDDLAALLLGRLAPDGGFSEMAGEPTDPWVSGQALESLLLLDDPALAPRLATALARVAELGLDGAATGDPPGFAGFPYLVGVDTVACTEATAAVGRAVALAFGRVDPPPEALARSLLEYLLRVQAPSGAWATIPVLGDAGAMTSASADALSAVAALAVALGEERRALAAVERAAAWLAGTYDREAGGFPVNPRRTAGAARFVHGLDEAVALALLDAADLGRRAGVAEPIGPARLVVDDLAARFEPSQLPPDAAAEAAMEDYRFQRLLPPQYRTSASEFAWLPHSWRLVLATALAAETDAPAIQRDAWAAEAARLRAHVPLLPALYREVPQTWKLAEVLMGPAAVRAAERAGVRPGLVPLVRPRPRDGVRGGPGG